MTRNKPRPRIGTDSPSAAQGDWSVRCIHGWVEMTTGVKTFVARTALAGLGLLIWASCVSVARAELAFVLNSDDDSLSLIDTQTYHEVRRMPIGRGPHHLMMTPDNRTLLIGDTLSNELVAVNPHTAKILRRIPHIGDPYQLGFSPDGRWFVTNGNRFDRVDIYRYHAPDFTLAARLPLKSVPSHMAFSKDSQTVYVTLQETDRVVAIDLPTQTVKWFGATGPTPAGIWLTPDQRHLLVGITGADYVQVLDARTGAAITNIPTGKGAHNFVGLNDGRHVLVSNRAGDSISEIDEQTDKAVETFPLTGGPDDMWLRKDGAELWVTARWHREVKVVDMKTKKVTHVIRVGRSPHGIFFYDHTPNR